MPLDRRKTSNLIYVTNSMANQLNHFIIFCLCFVLVNSPAESSFFSCPTQCTCILDERVVNCSNRSLRKILDIPHEVKSLTFHNNKIVGDELRNGHFQHLLNLHSLDLSDNRLKFVNLTFPSNIPLSSLNFNRCWLDTVPFISKPENVTKLLLSNNLISSIKNKFNKWRNLHQLDLSINKITIIYNNTFHHLKELIFLNLCKNKINLIESGSFFHLPSLEILILCKNKLRDLKNLTCTSTEDQPCTRIFQNLQHLDLSWNHISKVDSLTFQGMPRLKTLLMSHNKILSLGDGAFYNLPMLSTLYLDYNKIVSVMNEWLYGLESLEVISLSNNSITTIEELAWKFSKRIKHLNLSHNQLTRLENQIFESLASLSLLDLSFNDIYFIDKLAFSNFRGLHHLNLSHNLLSSTIEDLNGIFKYCSSLSTISLKSNRIHALNPIIFQELCNVSVIDLLDNDINSVSNGTFDKLINLKALHLSSSSLLCDCKLIAFKQWLDNHYLSTWSLNASCFHPQNLKGQNIIALNIQELICGEHPIPSLLQQPSDMMKQKGDNVTLECSATATLSGDTNTSSSSANMTVLWKRGPQKTILVENINLRIRNMQRVEGSHIFFTSLLLLYNVNYYDDDNYSCFIKNKFGYAISSPAWVRVVSLPHVIEQPKNKIVKQDSEVIIDCKGIGYPLPEVYWEKVDTTKFAAADDKRLILSHRAGEKSFHSNDAVSDIIKNVPLHIKPVKAIDTGKYKCTAKSAVGIHSVYVNITVLYPPIIEILPSKIEVGLGKTAVIKCIFTAYPSPQVEWYFNNKILHRDSRYFLTGNKQLLVIVNIQASDLGSYTCKVSNKLGKRNKSILLLQLQDNFNGEHEENQWSSFWNTPGVVLIVSLCILFTIFIWLVFFCCFKKFSSDPLQQDEPMQAICESTTFIPTTAEFKSIPHNSRHDTTFETCSLNTKSEIPNYLDRHSYICRCHCHGRAKETFSKPKKHRSRTTSNRSRKRNNCRPNIVSGDIFPSDTEADGNNLSSLVTQTSHLLHSNEPP